MNPPTRTLFAAPVILLLLACDGSRPPNAATVTVAPPPTPSASASATTPIAPEPNLEERETTAVLHSFPIEGFHGKFHASIEAVEAPHLEESKDDHGGDIIKTDVAIGARHPIMCVVKPAKLDVTDVMSRIAANLGNYEWSTRRMKIGADGSRATLRAAFLIRDPKTHELLSVQKTTLAVGEGGSILCNQLDTGYEKTFARVVDGLLTSANDFGERTPRYTEVWVPEAAGAGTAVWTQSLVPNGDGTTEWDVKQIGAEIQGDHFRVTVLESQTDANAQGEVLNGGHMFRASDGEAIMFGVARVGPREYLMRGSARGNDGATRARTSAPLSTFFSQGPRLRSLAASSSGAPVSWVEFGGLAPSGSADVLRERVAKRSGDAELVITSKDEVETCHVSPSPTEVLACDSIVLKGKNGTETLRRVFATPAP